ncbi:MAG TPA: ATP-binding protein [Nitrososphaeraceae archaeon]|jgi:signal transduction histidine kinase|nr:ATP-binding protein [Nitrososphaeraceae archaeon]
MSGNDTNKNNNQEINDKHRNMTMNTDTNNNMMTHDHEAFIHQIRLFSGLTSQELQSIDKGKEVWFEAGDKIIAEGEHDTFYVLLDGKVEVILRDGSKEAVLSTYNPGDHFGELPIILGWTSHSCAAYATKKSHLLKWGQEEFWRMIYSSPALTRQILNSMAQLLKTLETVLQQNQKLIALGGLAAGLAHELNNPAAAANRAVTQLSDSIREWRSLVQKLNERQSMTAPQWSYLSKLRNDTLELNSNLNSLNKNSTNNSYTTDDALIQSEKEDQVSDWLDSHGINDGWKIASDLVNFGVNIDKLNDITSNVILPQLSSASSDNKAVQQNLLLEDILRWLNATTRVDHLLYEIKSSTTRISDLISAVKSYSYMDQAPLQDVNIHDGIESTLTMLQHKLKKADITIIREYESDLPHVNAIGNELNQVWTNLIDNAIDSIGSHGTILIRTKNERKSHILVEIVDSGNQGIPKKIQPRIFEPFFTTKELGKGTGLGLSISHRIIVDTHKGDIRFSSKPGETSFQVRLPIIYKGIEQKYWEWIKPENTSNSANDNNSTQSVG